MPPCPMSDLDPWYDYGHTRAVKIAISVPEPIFRRAEQAARQLRVPRSQFYSRAVEAYLRQAALEDVTERLNAVYAEQPAEPDPFLAGAARRNLRRNK